MNTPMTFQTVNTTQTCVAIHMCRHDRVAFRDVLTFIHSAAGLVTQTCNVTLTPNTDPTTGAEVVVEVQSCTMTTTPAGKEDDDHRVGSDPSTTSD